VEKIVKAQFPKVEIQEASSDENYDIRIVLGKNS